MSKYNKEYSQRYYQEHREKYIAYAKARIEANRERYNGYAREYYQKNKERLNAAGLAYYYAHKKEVLKQHRKYKQQHAILYGNAFGIYGVNKAPRPTDECCPFCGRKRQLQWHHEGNNPDNGLWICVRCHVTYHYVKRYEKLKALISEIK